MLHVILQILAVIGIILLCILGLIILLLLLILFAPIRYRVRGSKNEEEILLRVRASYLLHLFSLRYDYPKPGNIVITILGIPIYVSDKKAEDTKGKEEAHKEDGLKEDGQQEDAHKEDVLKEDGQQEGAHKEDVLKEDAQQEDAHKEDGDNPSNESAREQREAETGAGNFLRHPIKWIKEKLRKIKYTICSICDKIKNVWNKIKHFFENISYYKDILTDTENQRLFGRTKKRVFKMLKSIRPRVLHAQIRIGTGSPDTTGYLCGLYGMLSPILGNNVSMEADFEKAILEGNVYAKGRITLFTILLQAGKILLDKQLRIFIKQLKREEI